MNTVHTPENVMAESVTKFAEQTTIPTLCGLYAKAVELVLVPDETFKRKLDLIEKAEDMTTPQKLETMNQAEETHILDKLFCAGITLLVLATATWKASGFSVHFLRGSLNPILSSIAKQQAWRPCCFAFIYEKSQKAKEKLTSATLKDWTYHDSCELPFCGYLL